DALRIQGRQPVAVPRKSVPVLLSIFDEIPVSQFLVKAVLAFVESIRRRAIDRAFAPMENDVAYREEALLIEREFEHSDWEALESHGSSPHLG
ncbi:MAG: hypothetical protein L0099_16030, partial [Acidobacteria bacterium]|nr:hypothetical protein [Acidobacteriota bacterium]